jgi:hypothetical protein
MAREEEKQGWLYLANELLHVSMTNRIKHVAATLLDASRRGVDDLLVQCVGMVYFKNFVLNDGHS